MDLNADYFNRLSLGLIEKFRVTPNAAMQKLSALKLNLICGEEIRSSLPLQAALITAVNTGKRAFLGGIYIEMPDAISCLLPWPRHKTLNDIVIELGGIVQKKCDRATFSLLFGIPAFIDENAIQVVCNTWQAGILVDGEKFELAQTGAIPTAGVFAGALGVALSFLRNSGINISACDKSVGISLWRPELPWLDRLGNGPEILLLPEKYWLLGLGHLGQAYLWNIGLLSYGQCKSPKILLNDYDKIVNANWSAGLLCELTDRGHKTRLCSKWLEERGFETVISERLFDERTKRINNEPFLALCGFDNVNARHFLEDAGFDLIVEAGLGGSLQTFDIMALHTFPDAKKSAKEVWPLESRPKENINKVVLDILKKEQSEACGIIPLTIAGKSLSASFVGACTGSIAIAELIRALNGGKRYDKIVVQLRNLGEVVATHNVKNDGYYSTELSRNGFIDI